MVAVSPGASRTISQETPWLVSSRWRSRGRPLSASKVPQWTGITTYHHGGSGGSRELAAALQASTAGETARLAAAAAKLGIPHIHVSTDYVFDGRKSIPYREDDMPCPLNVYGHSKLDGERAVRDALPSALVLRSSWVYSPWGHNFVTTMLRLADTREVVQVVNDQRGATNN
jgi:dTDP-4-dehydrorhamnose reductase